MFDRLDLQHQLLFFNFHPLDICIIGCIYWAYILLCISKTMIKVWGLELGKLPKSWPHLDSSLLSWNDYAVANLLKSRNLGEAIDVSDDDTYVRGSRCDRRIKRQRVRLSSGIDLQYVNPRLFGLKVRTQREGGPQCHRMPIGRVGATSRVTLIRAILS